MDREIFCFSSSMAVILASTIWPSERTSLRLVDAPVSNLGNMDQAVHAGTTSAKAPKVISLTMRTEATSPTWYLSMNTCQGSML